MGGVVGGDKWMDFLDKTCWGGGAEGGVSERM